MTVIRTSSVALFVSTLALAAAAQDRPAGLATAPAQSTLPQDCAKPMARHDHGTEMGIPASKFVSRACAPSAAASAPQAKPGHDHAKFHKNQ